MKFTLVCFLWLAPLVGFADPAPVPSSTPCPEPDDVEKRRWLNEHVIAVDKSGFALEPYDFVGGWNLGPSFVQNHFPNHEWNLQVRADPYKPEAVCAYKATGLPMPKGGLDRNKYIFADYVVPHMLEKAQASGLPIVIFAHGGLNYVHQAIQRAAHDGPIAEDGPDPKNRCYPIYICWDSSFSSSYVDHLLHLRNGVNISDQNPWLTYSTAPVYLATDLATSIVRFPRTLLDLVLRSDLKSASVGPLTHNESHFHDVQDATGRYEELRFAAHAKQEEWDTEEKARLPEQAQKNIDTISINLATQWREIRREHPDWTPMSVSKGPYRPTPGDSFMRTIGYFALLPPKLAVIAGFSGAGVDMWNVMSRRTQVMYHYEPSFRPGLSSETAHLRYLETNPDLREGDSTGIGCMAVFLRRLEAAQQKRHCLDVTLIGHSMGAMVFDEGLREFPKIRYHRIVYMAAACTIRDFYRTVIPYLLQPGNHTEFYGLSLHPRAENRDRATGENLEGELLPRGSLLVWIDEFLNNPKSFADRTFGQFENAMLASRMFPPKIQNRLHLVALSAGPDEDGIQEHGGFASRQFWQPDFYSMPGQIHRGLSKADQEDANSKARRFFIDPKIEKENGRKWLPTRY